MKTNNTHLREGFTLIEVIITLVVLAVVAAMLAGFFGTSIKESSSPVFRLKAVYSLNQVIGKITSSYNNSSGQLPQWNRSTAYTQNAIVIPTTANGYMYICTRAGTSGATEPTVKSK